MQIPILNGVYTDSNADFRVSYPVNMVPVPGKTGFSELYLRPSYGVVSWATGTGQDRGAFNWNGTLYRVSGTSLISIDSSGTVTTIGTISGTGLAQFDKSFDYMSISADNKMWLYDGAALTQITDADLGSVLSHIWVDGYFMTTDGEYLVVTELANPFSVDPAKYGSSEADPDAIKAVLKPRNEPHALNRYTTEVFYNSGGSGFPFTRNASALIKKGTVGSRTCCNFGNVIAFMGSGVNEDISIYVAASGNTTKIADREIDLILQEYTEDELSGCLLEYVNDETEKLYVHLPDYTLVYDKDMSTITQVPVWYILSNWNFNTGDKKRYNARNIVKCYNKWIAGDPDTTNIGYLTSGLQTLYGNDIGWEFSTVMLYNEGRQAIIHQLELEGLTGRQAQGDNPSIFTSYSHDGENFSQRKRITLGARGNRRKRMMWLNQGVIDNYRVQKFEGMSDCMASFARLEMRLEGLNG